MITEFEQRLAEVLAARLPLPFTGRAAVAPGADPGGESMLIVGVRKAEILEEDFLAHRGVSLPGESVLRRVVHLRCSVSLEAVPETDRSEQLRLLEAALYVLDSAEFRNASVLPDGEDRGFFIHRMSIAEVSVPFVRLPDAPRAIALTAEGWFWPVGTPAREGNSIREALLRSGVLPVRLEVPRLVAGGGPATLTIRFSGSGKLSLRQGEPPRTQPFGTLALALQDAAGRPGAGTLTAGVEEIPGIHRMEWSGSDITVVYTPPAASAVDFLILALDNAGQGLGTVLGRFPLNVLEG